MTLAHLGVIFSRGGFMLKETNNLKRMLVIGALLILLVIGAHGTIGQGRAKPRERLADQEWEYLAVAGPSPANIAESRLRKEPNGQFQTEAYGLEQQLDKLGANGWELVAVGGPPTEPAYYFKRRK
jgi:hypothetical protein